MITVRRIGPADGPLLRSVRLSAIADSPGVYATTLAQAEVRPLGQWDRVAEAGSVGIDQGTWFAEVGADPDAPTAPVTAGMVNAYRTKDDLITLTSLWSAPGHRGVGVAATLVEEVTRWAVASGGVALRLWVVERNQFARRFYEDLGFVATGASMAYEPDPELVEFEMRKVLV